MPDFSKQESGEKNKWYEYSIKFFINIYKVFEMRTKKMKDFALKNKIL